MENDNFLFIVRPTLGPRTTKGKARQDFVSVIIIPVQKRSHKLFAGDTRDETPLAQPNQSVNRYVKYSHRPNSVSV